eukprot:TRINITY_DN2808_c0_g2_i2.p1 TRINITY_DN2808_c0_g2~~TRINITY_DN2808_c0_g2_i2.p1  ORF type:complete len:111 (-),score=26.38 TRINITY_DN2808_c0_g2_i2:119-451(-)
MEKTKTATDSSDSFELFKPMSVTLKKIQQLSTSQVERIAKLAIKAMAKTQSLPDVCKFISTSMNVKSGGALSWICMASTDPNMCGYLFRCKGYVQFMLGEHYFLVASTAA